MFTTSGRDKEGYADQGAPRKPYCTRLPAMSHEPEDWTHVQAFIRGRGIDPEFARFNAWYPSWDAGDSWLRVVIPAASQDQANQFWQARLVEPPPEGRTATRINEKVGTHVLEGGNTPKRYQSPHAARGDALIVVHPRHGWADAPAGTVLVEGPFDALAAAELGFVGVALMGNTPSEEALAHAVRWLKTSPPAVLVADDDAVTQGAALARRLLVNHGVKSLRVLTPYPRKDLAEMSLMDRRHFFRDEGFNV